jgi:hypothetical protein
VISAIKVCGTCGAKISGDATREVCPAYLLETGLRLFEKYSVAEVARLAQFRSASQYDKCVDQVALAFTQRLAGDTAGAKVSAEQASGEPIFSKDLYAALIHPGPSRLVLHGGNSWAILSS